MRLPTDRLRAIWYAQLLALAAGIAVVPPAIWWATKTPAHATKLSPWAPPSAGPVAATEFSFDLASFDVELWPAERHSIPADDEPQAASADAGPPATPALTLIGILTERTDGEPRQRAVLYHADRDELIFAAVGDQVSELMLNTISETCVTLAQSEWMYRLPLDGKPAWEPRSRSEP